MTDFYISDTHFGHANIIGFCNRPFADVHQMDRAMVELWNSRVTENDHVWHLGDFCYKSGNDPRSYLRQLQGHIHLIVGNHDFKGLLRLPDLSDYVDSVEHATSRDDGHGHRMFMCHYPLAYPPRHIWCLYGHIHDNVVWPGFDVVMSQERSLNCCVEVNGYMPVTFDELVRNNARWRESCRNR
ncbi:Predicted phosphoesterase or phosphohydrolase [Slackia heliotrinireducens]|uniref:Predicted phosphoesterase or phosphohydrolase n=1 Tax=Slackia heliotrinireducens (strain ATCC 29202 / DSM 20476 / NCTC 11029 / RHS 1) TaxID=471855 RepID=C7N821_SLAHD|nr:metallophosphoesterase [Slackia heliotrinireducens]ACV23056.1 predicted phosphoesterase or phosphohydrolase [Slackia heliotrinireducens DSM 20476]VEH02003.1 Predicted phosphoesterase or phosphohydrolase [Slackia heliotrinireducens]